MSPGDRIGTAHILVDPEEVVALAESDYPDQTQGNAPEEDTSRTIATHLIEFLKHEVAQIRPPRACWPYSLGLET